MKPTDAQAAKEITTLVRYLQRHQQRLDYQFARKGGYPMASGGIESANKCICHVRLKRSRAGWDVTNANQMLALHRAKYNGTFDRVLARCRPSIQELPRGSLLKNEECTRSYSSRLSGSPPSVCRHHPGCIP
jgi:hypothetical protein